MRFIICTEDQFRTFQGVHLRCPDTWYLNDAIQTAERDGFKAIYLHYSAKGARFSVPCDVLAELFTMCSTNCGDITVTVVDPRGHEEHEAKVHSVPRVWAVGGAK